MPQKSWREKSREAIEESVRQWKADSEGKRLSATPEEAERLIEDAYPFGERTGWPYKAFLHARMDVLAEMFPDRYGDRMRQQKKTRREAYQRQMKHRRERFGEVPVTPDVVPTGQVKMEL